MGRHETPTAPHETLPLRTNSRSFNQLEVLPELSSLAFSHWTHDKSKHPSHASNTYTRVTRGDAKVFQTTSHHFQPFLAFPLEQHAFQLKICERQEMSSKSDCFE